MTQERASFKKEFVVRVKVVKKESYRGCKLPA